MAKTKPTPPSTLPDDANSLAILFYLASPDATPPNHPRVSVQFPGASFDHAVSEYTTLTNGQKNTLRSLLLALRDETFTLEGYS